ncbi:hypothetical protein GCM10009789_85190 [Kribbella sancticallisti]|uniref:Tachylectin n=1 Tax=Kribbella sancticallisti TaxID=460087 RepID=A0ABN2EVS5_9ACTN
MGSRVSVALGAAALVVGLATTPAHAVQTETGSTASTTAPCALSLGSVNAGGDHLSQRITATAPITAGNTGVVAPNRFADGLARLSGSWTHEPEVPGTTSYVGQVVLGSSMYTAGYRLNSGDEKVDLARIGGGWDQFSFFEESRYDEGASSTSVYRTHEYGLRKDGTLVRWRLAKGVWQSAGSYPGFSAVRTMTLISQTRTYDTFLANTRSGALYTIRIPVAVPMKPVVKVVRSSTWQAFDHLIAEKCGQYGTLLLGIDKETQAGYLYAVGRASGTSTVIKGLGKVPTTFNAPVYFRWAGVAWANPPLSGE